MSQYNSCDPTVALQISDLYARFYISADRRDEGDHAELFAEDGVLQYDSHVWRGRSTIRQFFREYSAKNDASKRTARHLTINRLVEMVSENECRVRYVAIVFSGHGDWPISTTMPSGIADVDDRCVRDDNGAWVISYRRAVSVFANSALFDPSA